MGQTYDSGKLRVGAWTRRWRWPTGTASTRARRESKRARTAARPRHGHLPRVDRRQRVRGARHRRASSADGFIEIYTRHAGDGPGHRHQLRAAGGRRVRRADRAGSASCRATPTAAAASAAPARARCSPAARRCGWPPSAPCDKAQDAGRRRARSAPRPTSSTSHGEFRIVGTDREIGLFELAARAGRAGRSSWTRPARSQDRAGPTAATSARSRSTPTPARSRCSSYASVNDVGRVVNPMIVRGQLDGGAVQGLGQALCEQVVYEREVGPAADRPASSTTRCRAPTWCGASRTELDQSHAVPDQPARRQGRRRTRHHRRHAGGGQRGGRCAGARRRRLSAHCRTADAADQPSASGRHCADEPRGGVTVGPQPASTCVPIPALHLLTRRTGPAGRRGARADRCGAMGYPSMQGER